MIAPLFEKSVFPLTSDERVFGAGQEHGLKLNSISLHQLDALAVLRDVDVPAEPIFDVAGHRVCRFGFAMC